MRLGQIRQGDRLVAVIVGQKTGRFKNVWEVRPVCDPWSVVDLIQRAESSGATLTDFAESHATDAVEAELEIPIAPPEVWAAGSTYQASTARRDEEHKTSGKLHSRVYESERPELFLKGTARTCVGSGAVIGLRVDAKVTAPEPELAIVLGLQGKILGYTLANDVSARDIERENPLYLPQSKVYTASCALGPTIVTADELEDPYSLEIRCRIVRSGQTIFEESSSTGRMNRKIEDLVQFLYRSNPVPGGSVLCTGTGIMVPDDSALQPGDVVTIECAAIGALTNSVAVV
jgi:2-dehydro-3-deoxy-D-arabinonate dehydratase